MTSPHDSDLRRLLDDAVSDVHPDRGPEEIRARAKRPSATRWVPITLAAAAATAVVIGGGAWLAQQQPSSNPPAAGPGTTKEPTSQTPAGPARTVNATVYYVGATASGPRLFPEVRRVTDVTASDLQVSVDEALTGSPNDQDHQNPFEDLGVTATATVAGGVVTIDLSGPVDRPSGMDDETAETAVQSLVRTATAAAKTNQPVTFEESGAPVDRVLGVSTASPVPPASDDSVLAPVLIDSPTNGATVPTEFTVNGRAATFEANVVWELKRGDETVRDGFTTALECCTLTPYSFTVTAPPGEYTLVVHDTDESDGEGVGISQDTKDITVE